MAKDREMLKEAIAEAKAVKDMAIANAKAALEEAFSPQLKSMLSMKLQEMENELDEEYVDMDPKGGKYDHGNIEEYDEEHEDPITGKRVRAKDVTEDDDNDMMEVDLEELLAELNKEDEDETLKEAKDEDDSEDDEDDSEDKDDEGEKINLEDFTDEDLTAMIEDVIRDMIKDGELEAGHEGMENEPGAEVKVEDEDEIDLQELLREIEEIESLEERKKYGGNKGDEKRDDMKKEKEGHGSGPKKKDTAEDEKEIDYKKKLKEELEEAYSTIESLKSELNEINLLNAKLLYTNKIFKTKNLNESQKVKVLSSFDKATTVGEVKLVFETLSEGIKAAKNTIKENLGSASKATITPSVKKPIVESNEAFLRMQKLAGIIK
jgi:hypothetical protein